MAIYDMLNFSRNLKISITLVLIGFIVHFIGFVAPYWNVIPDVDQLGDTDRIISIGLWKVCQRYGLEQKCKNYEPVSDTSQIQACQALETLSVIFYLLCLLMFWLSRRHPVYGAEILLFCTILSIATVQTTSIGAICWVTISTIQDKYRLSWAFILTVISVIFPLVSSWFISQERKHFMVLARRSSSVQTETGETLIQ